VGAWYKFTCANCGYSAEVSGGRDVGFVAVVRTMVCKDCQELVNVLIGREGKDGPTGDPEYDKDLGKCPGCEGRHVAAWKKGRPCPKCSQAMTKGTETTFWD
jgi:hypothetical protein